MIDEFARNDLSTNPHEQGLYLDKLDAYIIGGFLNSFTYLGIHAIGSIDNGCSLFECSECLD